MASNCVKFYCTEDDFDSTSVVGLVPDQFRVLVNQDDQPELTEGYVAVLKLDRSQLDARDAPRIKLLNNILLITIQDNG